MKLLHRDSVTLRARLDVSLVGAVTQKQVFSPGGEIEQQLLREEEEEGEREEESSLGKQKIHARRLRTLNAGIRVITGF